MPLIGERALKWVRLGLVLTVASCGASAGSAAMGSGPGAPPPGAPPVLPPAPMPAPVATGEWGHAPVKSAPTGENVVAYTDPGELPHLEVASDHKPFPLEHTHVKAALSGFVAEVEVRQTYQNPHDTAIEAVYVFPLPENSAVHQMRMEIGKRVIEAKIERRGAARRIYERAKAQGHTAALLEQERPNVFTQSVANIEPHTKIDVVIRYVQDLTYDAGEYEFVFPMVVGPRYFPGAPLEGPQAGN